MSIKTISSILLVASMLASCTHEDLSHCVDPTGTSISFRYEWEGATASVLPMQRADLFLFDANQRFVYSLTDSEGPFVASRSYHIPLAPGTYTAVAWGNYHEGSLQINPTSFVKGVTTLDEARMLLKGASPDGRSAESSVTGPSAPLYHALERSILIRDKQTTNAVMTLIRNTKEINLSVRFLLPDGSPCDDASHRCTPTIRSNDGLLNFENTRLSSPYFVYAPTTKTDITGGYNALFHKMRLNIDEQSEILLTKADGSDEPFYRENLITWLIGTGFTTQEKLDETHVYNIELQFTCDHNATNLTVRIFVNGWEYIATSDEV